MWKQRGPVWMPELNSSPVPGLDLETVEFAVKQNVVVMPGVLTPSEVMAAVKAGADFVKVFPVRPGRRRGLYSGAAAVHFPACPSSRREE